MKIMGGKKLIDRIKIPVGKRSKYHVKTWELDLYFPPVTYKKRDELQQLLVKRYGENEKKWPERSEMVHQIILLAELEDGSPAFDHDDVEIWLTELDAVVVDKLYLWLLDKALGLERDEDPKAESGTTPTSDSDSASGML